MLEKQVPVILEVLVGRVPRAMMNSVPRALAAGVW